MRKGRWEALMRNMAWWSY